MSISETILLIASVIIALGVIFTMLKRIRTFLRKLDRLGMLLEDMTTHLSDAPDAFKILADIISHFGTTSGATLKDQMVSLTESVANLTEVARTQKVSSIVLENQVEVIKELTNMERQQATGERARMMQLLQQMEGKLALSDVAGLQEKKDKNVDSQ